MRLERKLPNVAIRSVEAQRVVTAVVATTSADAGSPVRSAMSPIASFSPSMPISRRSPAGDVATIETMPLVMMWKSGSVVPRAMIVSPGA